VLIRLIGPFFGFVASILFTKVDRPLPSPAYLRELAIRLPPLPFSDAAAASGRLCILIPHDMVSYKQNIEYKWVEGLYFAPPFVCDYLSWVHGTFQVRGPPPRGADHHRRVGRAANPPALVERARCRPQSISGWPQQTPHLLFTTGDEPTEEVKSTLGDVPVWEVPIKYGILEVEVCKPLHAAIGTRAHT